MKKTILSLMLMVAFLPPFTASGQTYYDFALEELLGSSTNSIIRAVNPTEAVAYYETATDTRLVLVDINLNIKEISLPQNMYVRDIRVSGTNIYFCGSMMTSPYLNHHRGFIAHASYNDFGSGVVQLHYDIIDSSDVSIFNRLIAYNEPATGMDKIVAVGECIYTQTSVRPCVGSMPYGPYLCGQRVVFECDFKFGLRRFINHDYVYTNVPNQLEYVDEVIETDNYIAIVGYDKNKNTITIHPCPKGANILSSFDTYYSYPGTADDGLSLIRGCSMDKDTIAIASLSLNTPTPIHLFETRIRTFDLASNIMTTSQAIYLGNDKMEPYEMVYMPNYQKLVMLMYFQFPPSQYNYTFLHLKPYSPIPYNARGLFESGSSLPYCSVDRLTTTHYISTGGDYWFMKDVTIDAVSKNCYTVDDVQVYKIGNKPSVKNNFTYNHYLPNPSFQKVNIPISVNSAYPPCIEQ